MTHARKVLIFILLCLLALPLHAQEKTGYEIALERIEAARVSGATQLDLSGLGLTALPPEIGQLKNLQWLSITIIYIRFHRKLEG
jgi:hypothetical protein